MTTNFGIPSQGEQPPRFRVDEFRGQSEIREPLSQAATHQIPVDSKRERPPMFNQTLTGSASLFSFAQNLCRIHPYVEVNKHRYEGMPFIKGSDITIISILKRFLAKENLSTINTAFASLNESQIKDAISYAVDFIESASRLEKAKTDSGTSIQPLKGIFENSDFFEGLSESVNNYWKEIDEKAENE